MRARRWLLWICIAAVALRWLAVVVLRSWASPDAMESGQIARGLVAGIGFVWNDFDYAGPSSIQSPTYPFFLAGLFLVFGSESALAYGVALAINCILGGLAAWGVVAMTREMGGREEEALVAAALFAVWPTQIYAATHAQAIVLITACVVWMIALFLRSERETGSRSWWIFCLVALVACLTEPTLLPITALSVPWMAIQRGLPAPVRLRRVAIMGVCAVVVMGPWTVRNWTVHGAFVPVKSGFWVNVWKGANDYATGTDRLRMPDEVRESRRGSVFSIHDSRGEEGEPLHQYDVLTPEQRRELDGRTEVEREKIFRRYVVTWVAAHPQRFVELCGIRLAKTLWIDTDNPKGTNFVYPASRALLWLLCVPGLWIAATRRWRLLYPLALFASCVGIYTLTLTAARFAIPLEPIQLAVGSASLCLLAERAGAFRR
jgi:4-amino-4-deoxy-L-arabinose transferase-like glycosyltransferase